MLQHRIVLPALLLAVSATSQQQMETGEPLPVVDLTPWPYQESNVLVILADDLGVEALQRYKEIYEALPASPWGGMCAFADDLDCSPTMPRLPNIESIMDQGVTFTQAWANPTCSPTRATILTGRYGFRYGIAEPVRAVPQAQVMPDDQTLPDCEVLIPELLPSSYRSGAFGKWHLTSATDTDALAGSPRDGYPWSHGFHRFEGRLHAFSGDICTPASMMEPDGWTEIVSINAGQPTAGTPFDDYMIQEQVDDARRWISHRSTPWFCYLAPQAPYEVWRWPPMQFGCSPVTAPCTVPSTIAERKDAWDATLEALDAFLGTLLGTLNAQAGAGRKWYDTTTIVFVGDNGTPCSVVRKPFEPVCAPGGCATTPGCSRSKESLWEGGLRVPFVIAGHDVAMGKRGTSNHELVNTVDVFETVRALTGASPSANPVDGVSLVPYISAGTPSRVRDFVYAELWDREEGKCFLGSAKVDRVLRMDVLGQDLKLHYALSQPERFVYDLLLNPCEIGDLGRKSWNMLSEIERSAFETKLAEILTPCDDCQ